MENHEATLLPTWDRYIANETLMSSITSPTRCPGPSGVACLAAGTTLHEIYHVRSAWVKCRCRSSVT